MGDAALTAYLVAVAMPAEKKGAQPTKKSFDIAHILSVRLVFSHAALGAVRDALPLLIGVLLLAQMLMDADLVRKIRLPSVSVAFGDLVQRYQRSVLPTVKKFRALQSEMRQFSIASVPPAPPGMSHAPAESDRVLRRSTTDPRHPGLRFKSQGA